MDQNNINPMLDENMISELINLLRNKKKVSPAITDVANLGAMSREQEIIEDAGNSAELTPRKGWLGKIVGKVGNFITSPLGQTLSSFIPGAGGLVQTLGNVMSKNDDEWFEEFKGVGATFNESLKLYATEDSGHNLKVQAYAGACEIVTGINAQDKFWENYMPSILAYVRKKTTNVLLDDTNLYRDAFIAATYLYAIYYHGAKLLKVAEKQPLNIPNMPALFPVVNPMNISQFSGVLKSLKDYLSTSVALPFAWREYIKWRFGTMFLSEDTGKPALISYAPIVYNGEGNRANEYDYVALTANATVEDYVSVIESLKTMAISSGRAMADLKLAYGSHSVTWEVEERHYDAKEFNLRCNLTIGSASGFNTRGPERSVPVLLDSRLNQSAAYQAVTLSTRAAASDNIADDFSTPFPTRKTLIYFYADQSTVDKLYEDTHAGMLSDDDLVHAGWNVVEWRANFNPMFVDYLPDDGDISMERLFAYTDLEDNTFVPSYQCMESAFWTQIVTALAMSLQLHNRPNYQYFMNQDKFGSAVVLTPLAYDFAAVLPGAIQTTQTVAMRNLTRGEYTHKTPPQERPGATEASKELAQAIVTH